MNPFSAVWNGLLDFLSNALTAIHDVLVPAFGDDAWGWAIIALTLIVRVLLLPLAIKQTRSMRGMQKIQPQVKEIQSKYKVDRELMRKDPDRYQKLKSKQQEELMALYKEEGVNPAASCLPLLAQMPIFFALFRILGSGGNALPDLVAGDFYFFTDYVPNETTTIDLGDGTSIDVVAHLGESLSSAGWPGWLLLALMMASMFITQRQMMARNAAEGPAATQQKIMMYVFPVFLGAISFNFPLAVVLYWVTTNLWQMVQQWIMFRVTAEDTPPASSGGQGGGSTPSGTNGGSTNGRAPKKKNSGPSSSPPKKKQGPTSSSSGSHLPSRKRR